jgi:hypothetical protein
MRVARFSRSTLVRFPASGGKSPYTWSAGTTLPVGLTLSPTTGALNGTVSGGVYNFSVVVADSAGSTAMAPFTLTMGYFTAPQTTNLTGRTGQAITFSLALTSVDGYYNPGNGDIALSATCANASIGFYFQGSYASQGYLHIAAPGTSQTVSVKLTPAPSATSAGCQIYAGDGGTGTTTLVSFLSNSVQQDFTVSLPSALSPVPLVAGSSVPFTLPVGITAIGGFNSQVNFSLNTGAGATPFFTTTGSATPASGGTVSLTASSGAGTYVSVLATSGTISHTFNIPVTVSTGSPGAPVVTMSGSPATIPSGGTASFPVYVSQSSASTSALSVYGFTGALYPVVRPSSLKGSGWATVFVNGPPVSTPTPYSFTVQASGTFGTGTSPAMVTVNPTGLQPDFLLSTMQTLALTPGVQTALPVIIGMVDGYTGGVTFTSITPAVSVVSTATFQAGATANVAFVLNAPFTLPPSVTVTGDDHAGHAHDLTFNCGWGVPGGGGGPYTARPVTATGYASIPIGGSVTVQFQLQTVVSLANLLSLPACQYPSTGQAVLTFQPQSTGAFIDSQGFPNINVLITAVGGIVGPISLTCGGVLYYSVFPFDTSCGAPTVTGLQTNGQSNNVVITGTTGTVTLTGACLSSVYALEDASADPVTGVSTDPSSVTYYPPTSISSGSASFEYYACPVTPSTVGGQSTCPATGSRGLALFYLAQVNGAPQGIRVPIQNGIFQTSLTVQAVSFGGAGNIGILGDVPGLTSFGPVVNPVWLANNGGTGPSSGPVAYVGGSKMSGFATFSVNPPVPSPVNLRADGLMPGIGTLNASGLTIPANASSTNSVSFTADTALGSHTAFWDPMQANWQVTPNPNPCPNAACGPAGSSSPPALTNWSTQFPVATTFTSPTPGTPNPIPATLLYLAASAAAATSGAAGGQADAFKNTWLEFSRLGVVNGATAFSGPANVTDWLFEPLTYYASGQGFDACAVDVQPLLLSATGSGQCGSFALLFLGALATNGITISAPNPGWIYPSPQVVRTTVSVNDTTAMMINNWSFAGSGTNVPPTTHSSYLFPYNTQRGYPDYMVPGPPSYGDLTSGFGTPGQNSPTPSEKIFDLHFIVDVLDANLLSSFSTLVPAVASSGPFFDPSYGRAYSNAADFESQAIAGYLLPLTLISPNVQAGVARKRGGTVDVALTPCAPGGGC